MYLVCDSQRKSSSRSFQLSFRRAAEASANVATGQETLEDRDPATGHLLHRLLEPRPRGLNRPGIYSIFAEYNPRSVIRHDTAIAPKESINLSGFNILITHTPPS